MSQIPNDRDDMDESSISELESATRHMGGSEKIQYNAATIGFIGENQDEFLLNRAQNA